MPYREVALCGAGASWWLRPEVADQCDRLVDGFRLGPVIGN